MGGAPLVVLLDLLRIGAKSSSSEEAVSESSDWEVLMLVDREAAAGVSGAAETVDYFG